MPDDRPIVERPTELMEKVKRMRRSLQLWPEHQVLKLVEYTEYIEGELSDIADKTRDFRLAVKLHSDDSENVR